MRTLVPGLFLCLAISTSGISTPAQSSTIPTSVDAAAVLDAAGPDQRKSLGAIYLIECPNVGAGSGFLLASGVIVTNSHVVSGCTEQNLVAISTANKTITFSRVIPDFNRDLALLIPSEKLTGGLMVSASDRPVPGTPVTTWGYPFLYNGASPLLSVGYVAGFRDVQPENRVGKAVKHIVVNGAFNHGNSGGPLLVARGSQVIGIVVLTYNFFPPELRGAIDRLLQEPNGLFWTLTNPDGTTREVSEPQITGAILDQFYQKTQVLIGEAIGASELQAFIREHRADLPVAVTASRKKSPRHAS
jgi:hypothetical protein